MFLTFYHVCPIFLYLLFYLLYSVSCSTLYNLNLLFYPVSSVFHVLPYISCSTLNLLLYLVYSVSAVLPFFSCFSCIFFSTLYILYLLFYPIYPVSPVLLYISCISCSTHIYTLYLLQCSISCSTLYILYLLFYPIYTVSSILSCIWCSTVYQVCISKVPVWRCIKEYQCESWIKAEKIFPITTWTSSKLYREHNNITLAETTYS